MLPLPAISRGKKKNKRCPRGPLEQNFKSNEAHLAGPSKTWNWFIGIFSFFYLPTFYFLLKYFPLFLKRKLLTHAVPPWSTDKNLTSAAAAIRPDLPKAADRFIGQTAGFFLGSRAGENVSGQEAVVPFSALCPLISLFAAMMAFRGGGDISHCRQVQPILLF
jgi:hypothetical protein